MAGVLWLLCALSAITACDDYDTFTTDRSAVLLFDRDTVAFDTMFTTIGSSTQTLVAYNKGDRGLRIASVRLERGAASPFRVNVDGQDLSQTAQAAAADFEVRRRDSLIVRIEVTLPHFGDTATHTEEDALVFTLESGVAQRVPLSASGLDAIFMRGHVVEADTMLTGSQPIVVYDSLVVAPAATLTIASGTTLYFHDGAGLKVRGRLLAQGTLEAPVVLRGDRTDHMFDYLPYDRLPSRWEGLTIATSSYSNELDYVDLHGACFGVACDSSSLEQSTIVLRNCRIHNVGGHGISAQHVQLTAVNCEVSNTLGHCVYVFGGDVSFAFCTLAQFYPLDARRGDALFVANLMDEVYRPLICADFLSCVITGYADDVIMGSFYDPRTSDLDINDPQQNFLFDHCFMATVVDDDDPSFIEPQLDDGPATESHEHNFRLLDTHAFIYDFSPVAASRICGAASTALASIVPADRMGRDRTADGKPDAGCYECAGTGADE